MADPAAAPKGDPAPRGLVARFMGVITSPRETFQSVVAHPRSFGILAVTTLLVSMCTTLPLTTEEGKQAALDQQVRVTESFTGRQLSDAEYEQMERRAGFALYTTAASTLVFIPIMAAVIAAILWAVFNAAMGGDASYRQVFAIVVHAGIISTLGALFTAPINYVRGTVSSSAANLRALLPMVDEGSLSGRMLGMVDFFGIWWVFVLAVGLAVLYRRRTQPIAVILLGVYAVIAVCIALVMSRFGGGA